LIAICENILKITIIWQNELFNGKELKAKQIICWIYSIQMQEILDFYVDLFV
jgi:hypothetical protein